MSNQYIIGLTIIFCCFAKADVGDECVVRYNQAPGVCKLSHDCLKAEEDAKRGTSPTLCGFSYDSIPIVCCQGSTVEANENSFLNIDNSDSFVYPDNIGTKPTTNVNKSEQKCKEYSKAVTGVVIAVPLITNPEQISIDVEKCDNNGVPLIVGGTPANAGEFPFMAVLGRYNGDNVIEWYCGGTLISDQYILTAAHCVRSKVAPVVKVRLGDLDLEKEDEGSEYVDYDVDDIKVHDDYRPRKSYNDIALIRLKKKVEFTSFIRPACLWSQRNFEYSTAIATGWGKTGHAEEPSSKLLKVTLNILDNSVCSRSFPKNNKTLPQGISSSMLCAGELMGDKDTCQGDSGGPLLITKKGNQCIFYVIGVTSFGKTVCGAKNTPAVYTRVSDYIPWIENTIW